jgi:plasmid stabilization system protein ParE
MGRKPWHRRSIAGAALMELKWTSNALSDVARLYAFLATVNQSAAVHTVQQLIAAPATLLANPRIGERLEEFDPRDVRRILIGHYELRYEIRHSTLYLLRLWHTREHR